MKLAIKALAIILTTCSLISQVSLAQRNVLIDDEPAVPLDLKPTDVIHWTAERAVADNSGRVTVLLRLKTSKNFALYEKKVSFQGEPGYFMEKQVSPATKSIVDPVTHKPIQVYYTGEFELTFKGIEPFKKDLFHFSVTFLSCSADICLFPYTQEFKLPTVFVKEALADQNIEKLKKAPKAEKVIANPQSVKKDPPPIAPIPPKVESQPQQTEVAQAPAPATPKPPQEPAKVEEQDLQSKVVSLMQAKQNSLWIILLLVFIGGMITNLTPCVYPMIPITIRVLSSQSKSPFLGASAYAVGILIVYTGLGLFAALTGSLFGSLMANTWFNLGFGLVMFMFALSMIGFGDFSRLQTIGSRLGTGQASLKNAFLMGTGAGLVASPCTGPVLAALLAVTAKDGDVAKSTLLLFVYSLGFSLPYVFLGGAAAKVSKTKVKPIVQVAIKTLFAAVMMTLGFYYLRIPAYQILKPLAPHWMQISTAMLSLGTIFGFLVLVRPSFYHSKLLLVMPALFLGFGFFALTQNKGVNTAAIEKGIVWIKTEQEALELAAKTNRPVLIDAWAEWCAACKEMDATTFKDVPLNQMFIDDEWILVKLDLTEVNESSDAILQKYEIQGLPTLTLLKPGGSLEGKKSIAGYASAAKLSHEMKNFLNQHK